MRSEHSPSGDRIGRPIIVASATMDQPEHVKGHRVTRLKAEAETLAEYQSVRRPGERGLLLRNRRRKPEERADLPPDRLCQGTREGEVSQGLTAPRAVRAIRLAGEVRDACPEWQRIEEE